VTAAGRKGSRWRRLHAGQKAKRLGCWLCSQPIDYQLDWPDPQSFSVDHAQPLSTHPHLAEDPGNLRSAHLSCNSSRGAKAPRPALGVTSRDW
jgi:5-methylcytosine-specific restriction endonuclease McrA